MFRLASQPAWSARPAIPGSHVKPARRRSVITRSVQVQTRLDCPTPFFEPLVRSFLLGVGTGALFEGAHVSLSALRLVGDVGLHRVSEALPAAFEGFTPMFLGDHVVALSSWLLFYIVEAVAIYAVLKRHPDDAEKAAKALDRLKTLPKRLLPLRLMVIKQIILAGLDTGPLQFASVATTVETTESTILPRPVRIPPHPVGNAQKSRERELSDRRKFLRNAWYAVAISEEVKEDPVGVEVLGQHIVLFRDEFGDIKCVDSVCPHRGAPLHKGVMSEHGGRRCVTCPYHAWAIDGEGILRDVPAAEHSEAWPRRKVVDAHTVKDRGGFVWFMALDKQHPLPEAEWPPIPYVYELDDPTWRPTFGSIDFECNHSGVFENAIDVSHIHLLHGDSFGNAEQQVIRGMQCRADPFSVTASFTLSNKPASALWEFSRVPEVHVTARAMLPSSSVITFTLARGLSFSTVVNTTPIDEHRTVNRFALVRKLAVDPVGAAMFNWPVWDGVARQAMLKILGQDKVMVEQLRPECLDREVSVRADMIQVAFRRLRQAWLDAN